jgi:hypothetical protein
MLDMDPMYFGTHGLGRPLQSFTPEPIRVLSNNSTVDCSKISSLQTNLDGDTSGFGAMFTVRSKSAPLKLVTLAFSTLDVPGAGNVEVTVYTKLGDYTGHENSPSVWTLISEATLVASPQGTGTIIPQANFEPVTMEPDQVRAFYVTLKTMDLRYAIDKRRIGDVAQQDDYLEIRVGAGLLEYPFSIFLFEPRLFGGTFHYAVLVDCKDLLQVSRVPLEFVLRRDEVFNATEVQSQVDVALKASIIDLIGTDQLLQDYKTFYELELIYVTSTFPRILKNPSAVAECQALSTKKKCIPLLAEIAFRHSDKLQSGQVNHAILKERATITANLNSDSIAVSYAGGLPVESTLILTLAGVPEGQPMNLDQTAYFEEITRRFLVEQFSNMPTVNVLGVNVTDQAQDGRRLRSGGSSSLNLATTITGEYRPPPFVDFDGVVSDAIDGDGYQLGDDLRTRREMPEFLKSGGAEYFASVTGVTASPADASKFEKRSSHDTGLGWWFPTILVFLGLGLMWCTYVVCKNRTRRKLLYDVQMSSLKNDGLDNAMNEMYNNPNVITAEVTPLT